MEAQPAETNIKSICKVKMVKCLPSRSANFFSVSNPVAGRQTLQLWVLLYQRGWKSTSSASRTSRTVATDSYCRTDHRLLLSLRCWARKSSGTKINTAFTGLHPCKAVRKPLTPWTGRMESTLSRLCSSNLACTRSNQRPTSQTSQESRSKQQNTLISVTISLISFLLVPFPSCIVGLSEVCRNFHTSKTPAWHIRHIGYSSCHSQPQLLGKEK